MKKILLIVLLSVLVLSSGMVLPLKTFATKVSYQYYYDVVEDVIKIEFTTEVAEVDQISCAEVVGAETGDQFTGSTGTTYELQEQDILSKEQIQHLVNQDIVVSGVWVPVDEEECFNWFGLNVIPAIGNGYYNKNGIYVPTDIISPETNPGDNYTYTYYQLTLPPDTDNIPSNTIFPSIGFYVPYQIIRSLRNRDFKDFSVPFYFILIY